MPNCAVGNCTNSNRKTKGTGIKYFRFPKNEDLADQWVVACRRKDKINLKYATVCSIHFDHKSIHIPLKHILLKYSPKTYRILKADAVPTLNLPGGLEEKENIGRSLRAANQSKQGEVEDIVKSELFTSQISEELNKSVEELECMVDPEYVVKQECVMDPEYVVKQEYVVDPEFVVKQECAMDPEYVVKQEYVVDSEYVVKQEYVEDSENVEKPESRMELDVRNELLPQLHTETESEIIQLKKRIEELEKQNTELSEEVKRQDSKIQQFKEAMAKILR